MKWPLRQTSIRVHFQPTGKATDRTQMMDPSFEPVGTDSVIIRNNGSTQTLTSPEMRVIAGGTPLSVEVRDPAGKALLKLRGTPLTHDENENIWGIKGLELRIHQASVSVASEGAPLNRFASETAFRSSVASRAGFPASTNSAASRKWTCRSRPKPVH
jgi:hypothetical protein